jgi:hypothetical protein
VTTGDAEFVMDGTLHMLSDVDGQITVWNGEPLDIGNDAGVLDADLNVTGTNQSQIASQVDFNSDADVDVAGGATLAFLGTVNFNTVNAANNAQFTGAGSVAFSGLVNVNEAVTLNMVGGQVDLDGLDNAGEFVNIDAPLAIHAETMANFGRANGGGGTNTLDVNNGGGAGVLTVTLDDPAGEWTLNGPGVMNLVNDNAVAVLLAGNDVNLNGTVNVTGDVQVDARVDIGGVVNINTAAEPLRLNGGALNTNQNTIAGGTISGVGVLNAPSARALHGFGTINTSVDFDGTANLLADDGTLTLNGAIADVNLIGTNDDDAILHVTNPWNTNVAQALTIRGGEVRGGTITNDGVGGILGDGLLSARVINNTLLSAGNGTHLIVETASDDNDWDGAANTGQLVANFNRTLEIRDTGAAFAFGGTVSAASGGRVYASGFGLNFQPGSTLSLTAATFQSDESSDLGGTVTIGAGTASTIQVQNNRFLSFETGSATTLNGNLQLLNNNIIIEQGATFSGPGALVVPDGSHVVGNNLANIGVLVDMQGAFRPGNFNGIGRVDLFDYQQGPGGELYVEMIGTALNAFDRLRDRRRLPQHRHRRSGAHGAVRARAGQHVQHHHRQQRDRDVRRRRCEWHARGASVPRELPVERRAARGRGRAVLLGGLRRRRRRRHDRLRDLGRRVGPQPAGRRRRGQRLRRQRLPALAAAIRQQADRRGATAGARRRTGAGGRRSRCDRDRAGLGASPLAGVEQRKYWRSVCRSQSQNSPVGVHLAAAVLGACAAAGREYCRETRGSHGLRS